MKRPLKIIIIIILLIITIPASAAAIARLVYPVKHVSLIAENSERFGVDPYLITAVIYVESGFEEESLSNAGAVGLMQIMPETATWISKKTGKNIEAGALKQPDNNIAFGTWYYSWLYKKYKSETLALAAYNSGHKNIDLWRDKGGVITDEDFVRDIPFKETKDYVIKVQKVKERYKLLYPNVF